MFPEWTMDAATNCNTTNHSTISLETVFSAELASVFGRAVGLLSLRRASATSRCCRDGAVIVLPKLAQEAAVSVYVCGGDDGTGSVATVETLTCGTDGWYWEPSPPMITARRGCAAAAFAGQLYVIGGHGMGQELAAAECFDPSSRKWSQLARMPTPRSWCAAATGPAGVFVVGGYGGRQYLADVEYYNTILGLWQQMEPMSVARSACTATCVCQELLVLGGFDGARLVDCVESLDIRGGRWKKASDLPQGRSWCGAALCSGRISVFGGVGHGCSGWRDLDTVISLDPNPESGWVPLMPMPLGQKVCFAACTRKELFVCGEGRNTTRGPPLPACYRYDEERLTWDKMPSMPCGRVGFSGAVLLS